MRDLPIEGLVELRKSPDMPGVYDVELNRVREIGAFDSFEFHAVLYPFSRRVNSDHISFLPFEGYVKDITTNQRSLYSPVEGIANNLFGLGLGLVIAIVFAVFNPKDLISVQSVVAVLGAYFIGKDLWRDVERALTGLTRSWRLRFLPGYYAFRLEEGSTLTNYSAFAKASRYGKASLLPDRMDFIQQSNSQTLRLYFGRYGLRAFCGDQAHVFSIHLAPACVQDFEEAGHLFGVKVTFGRSFLGLRACRDLFQSLKGGSIGCLGPDGEWREGAAFYRRTYTCGRLKLFARQGYLDRCSMILASP